MRIEARKLTRALLALVLTCAGCSEPSGSARSDAGAPNGTGGMTPAGGAGGATASGAGGVSQGGVPNGGGGSGPAGTSSSDGGTTSDAGRGGSGTGGTAGSGSASGGRAGAGAEAGNTGEAGNGAAGGAGAPDEPEGTLTVFYLDVGGSVMATDVLEPEERTIIEDAGQGPDGIALDVEQGHIYWTGMGVPADDDGFIRRSDLDGSNIITVVEPGGTYTPKQLRIDHANGKLYWSDREGMRVMRSNLDGSAIETLVTTGTSASDRQDNSNWCVGIALDLAGGYVYWSQKGPDNGMVGSLRRASLTMPAGEDSTNRSDIEVLFAGLPEPIDVDLDLERGHIYWTDRGDDTINRAPIEIPSGATAANRMDREILIEGVREAIGVTLDLERGRLYFTGGTGGRVGMANLDGSDVVNLVTGTAGLTGIAVVELP